MTAFTANPHHLICRDQYFGRGEAMGYNLCPAPSFISHRLARVLKYARSYDGRGNRRNRFTFVQPIARLHRPYFRTPTPCVCADFLLICRVRTPSCERARWRGGTKSRTLLCVNKNSAHFPNLKNLTANKPSIILLAPSPGGGWAKWR